MNDNNLNNNNPEMPNTTYHATTNQNTAIENPEVNMGGATSVNIQGNNYNNNQNIPNNPMNNPQQPNQFNNTFINNQSTIDNQNTQQQQPQTQTPNFSDYSSEYETNFYNTNEDNNQYYSYEPILQEKKNNANSLSNIIHSKEAKLMVFILLILIIFILIIPYVYDFILGLTRK